MEGIPYTRGRSSLIVALESTKNIEVAALDNSPEILTKILNLKERSSTINELSKEISTSTIFSPKCLPSDWL